MFSSIGGAVVKLQRFHCFRFSIRKMFNTTDLRGALVDTFLNLEKLDVNLFRSTHQMPNINSTVVYGGQVIGQSLVAALKTIPASLHPHSLHCYFLKAGNSNMPILYHVDRVRDGKSFSTRGVKAVQDGSNIFSCQISFHKDESESIVHQDSMPDVTPPEKLEDAETLIRSLLSRQDLTDKQKEAVQSRLDAHTTFNVRPVYPEAFLRIKSSAPKQYLWVKAKEPLGDDERLHLCVAAFMSDAYMISTMLLPHRAAGFQVGLALSLDHSMWFHRHNFKIDEDWLLYEIESTVAGASRGFAGGRLWTRNGQLVISTAQEGLIRGKLDDKEEML